MNTKSGHQMQHITKKAADSTVTQTLIRLLVARPTGLGHLRSQLHSSKMEETKAETKILVFPLSNKKEIQIRTVS